MNTSIKDSPPRLKPATATVATPTASTLKQQEESQREAWAHALGAKMVEAGNRMETDPVYRKKIQSMTR